MTAAILMPNTVPEMWAHNKQNLRIYFYVLIKIRFYLIKQVLTFLIICKTEICSKFNFFSCQICNIIWSFQKSDNSLQPHQLDKNNLQNQGPERNSKQKQDGDNLTRSQLSPMLRVNWILTDYLGCHKRQAHQQVKLMHFQERKEGVKKKCLC